jgi:hypothetical protein
MAAVVKRSKDKEKERPSCAGFNPSQGGIPSGRYLFYEFIETPLYLPFEIIFRQPGIHNKLRIFLLVIRKDQRNGESFALQRTTEELPDLLENQIMSEFLIFDLKTASAASDKNQFLDHPFVFPDKIFQWGYEPAHPNGSDKYDPVKSRKIVFYRFVAKRRPKQQQQVTPDPWPELLHLAT